MSLLVSLLCHYVVSPGVTAGVTTQRHRVTHPLLLRSLPPLLCHTGELAGACLLQLWRQLRAAAQLQAQRAQHAHTWQDRQQGQAAQTAVS